MNTVYCQKGNLGMKVEDLRCIYEPYFSTSKEITRTSGCNSLIFIKVLNIGVKQYTGADQYKYSLRSQM